MKLPEAILLRETLQRSPAASLVELDVADNQLDARAAGVVAEICGRASALRRLEVCVDIHANNNS